MKKRALFLCLAMLLVLFACGCEKECEHEWTDADCVNPRICDLCAEEVGQALGHKWEDATCTTAKTCSVCKKTEGNPLGHKWEAATCDQAKTCSACKATEGDPLTHIWLDATCTNPKTCTLCAKTEGEALAHTWKEATCTAPKTCSVCSVVEGTAAGHTPGEWELIAKDAVKAQGSFIQKCKVCDTQLDTKDETLTQLHDGTNFIITPAEYNARISSAIKEMNITGYISTVVSYQGMCTCAISKDGITKGYILFENESTAIHSSEEDKGVFTDVLLMITGADDEAMAVALVAMVMACDPALSVKDATSVVSALINLQEVSKNGISYIYGLQSGSLLVLACVE